MVPCMVRFRNAFDMGALSIDPLDDASRQRAG
jgi:hypothetical protein